MVALDMDVVSIPDMVSILDGDTGLPPGIPEGTPPRVENVAPNLDGTVAPTAVIQFDIVDDDLNLFDVVVSALFKATGTYEVVWDGENFAPRYTQGSRREAILGGFRYYVLRTGGWPESPKLRVRAFDTALNPVT